jgi:hypothetical protein
MMQYPAQRMIVALAPNLKTDEPLQIIVIERRKQVAGLVSDLRDFIQAKLRRIEFACHDVGILEHVPILALDDPQESACDRRRCIASTTTQLLQYVVPARRWNVLLELHEGQADH